MGVCKGTFLGMLVTSLYAVHSWACVHYRWRCVSLEEKTHLGRHLVATPQNSRYVNTARKSWTVGRMVEGGAIPAQPCHPREYCVQSLTQPRCNSTQSPCLVSILTQTFTSVISAPTNLLLTMPTSYDPSSRLS